MKAGDRGRALIQGAEVDDQDRVFFLDLVDANILAFSRMARINGIEVAVETGGRYERDLDGFGLNASSIKIHSHIAVDEISAATHIEHAAGNDSKLRKVGQGGKVIYEHGVR